MNNQNTFSPLSHNGKNLGLRKNCEIFFKGLNYAAHFTTVLKKLLVMHLGAREHHSTELLHSCSSSALASMDAAVFACRHRHRLPAVWKYLPPYKLLC